MSQARRFPIATAVTMATMLASTMPSSVLAAAPTADDAIAPAADEDPIAAAQALHNQALARFDVADYGGAIARWEAANDRLPDDPSTASIRRIIINNLAVALAKAYAIERDVRLLRRSRQLALDYERSIDALYPEAEAAAAEHARIAAFIADLDRQLEAAEPAPRPAAADEPARDDVPVAVERRAEPPQPRPRARKGWIAGGGVALGIGVAGIAMLAAGASLGAAANDVSAVREDKAARGRQFDRGRRANDLAIAGAVIAPLALATGIALVVVGVRGRARTKGHVAWSPWASDRGAGVVVGAGF